MSRGSYEHMLQVAKKKPKLKEVVDNIKNYSVEDINNLSGNPFAAWVKKHLIRMVEAHRGIDSESNSLKTATEIAAIMSEKSANNSIEYYKIYQYNGMDMNVGIRGKFDLEINQGDYFAVIDYGNVKINASTVRVSETDYSSLINSATFLTEMTMIEYNIEMQKNLEVKYQLSTKSDTDYSMAGIMSRSVRFG